MSKLCITHIDLDGISPLVLNEIFNQRFDDTVLLNYSDINTKEGLFILNDYPFPFSTFDEVLVIDLGVDKNFFEWIHNTFKKYTIIDHHETSAYLEGVENCHYDGTKSATKIYYDLLCKTKDTNEIIDSYVELVNTYDTWTEDSSVWDEAQDMNRLFWKMLTYYKKGLDKYKFFIDFYVRKLTNPNARYFGFSEFERGKIDDAIEKEALEVLFAQKNMRKKVDEKGNKYIVYHGSAKISHVCNTILKENLESKYIINFNTFNEKNYKQKQINGRISVRSQKDFDVTDLEHVNGHKNAGGGELPIQAVKDMWFNKDKHLGFKDIDLPV